MKNKTIVMLIAGFLIPVILIAGENEKEKINIDGFNAS